MVPGGHVTDRTTVFVRGYSANWLHKDYGKKELQVARRLREGQAIRVVAEEEFRKLVERRRRARCLDRVAGEPIEWLLPVSKAAAERSALKSGSLDRDRTVAGRLEQGHLRQQLLGGADSKDCALCDSRFPSRLLVAAHIKPRARCRRAERLDIPAIAFCVCVLGCDALYEQGLVAVEDGGRIVVSQGGFRGRTAELLRHLQHQRCKAWGRSNEKYFRWHRREVFQAWA
jgi:hypothetical protein